MAEKSAKREAAQQNIDTRTFHCYTREINIAVGEIHFTSLETAWRLN
jgi:hypothetical protein